MGSCHHRHRHLHPCLCRRRRFHHLRGHLRPHS